MTMRSSSMQGDLLRVVLLGFLWGVQPAIVKHAALRGVDPFSFVLGAVAVAAALLVCINRPGRQAVSRLYRNRRFFLTAAALGFFLPLCVRASISDQAPLYFLTVSVALTPMLVALLSAALRREPPSGAVLLAILLGLSGTVLIVSRELAQASGGLPLKTLAALAVPLLYALNQVFVYRAYPQDEPPTLVAAGESLCSFGLALVAVAGQQLLFPGMAALSWTFAPETFLWGAVTALEGVVFFWVISRSGPMLVSSAIYAAIAFGVLWGWLLFDEAIGVEAVFGMILIALSAGTIAHWKSRAAVPA